MATRLPTRTKTALTILAAVALVLSVTFPLFSSRLPMGHDTLEYLIRQVEFHQDLAKGTLLPQWAPDLAYGAGEPLFEFNPPMIYYLAEFWHLLGFAFVTSINLACVVLVALSAWGMFLLGQLYFGSWGGWLAAVAYLYAPYFGVNLYVRGALAEFAAFPFYAFCLFGFGAYARSRKRSHWLTGVLAYAGILFSHNGAALFFTPLLLAFFLLTAYEARSWRTLVNQAAGWLLGLGLSACIWIPSLAEKKYVHLERLLQGWNRYSNYFVAAHEFVSTRWAYGGMRAAPYNRMSLSLGWSHLLLLLVAVAAGARYRSASAWRWLVFFGGSTAILCFLMTRWSAPIWDRVALLQYVAFPWRMLGMASLCIALLIATLGQSLQRRDHPGTAWYAAVLAFLIIPNIGHNRPILYRTEPEDKWTPRQLAVEGREPTTLYEYMPLWVMRPPVYIPQQFLVAAGEAEVRVTTRTNTTWAAEVRADRGAVLDLAINYYPGWLVRIDGRTAPIMPANPSGLIRLEVPPGQHVVHASFERTRPRWSGEIITLCSLLVMGTLSVWPVIRKRKPTESGRPSSAA